MTAPLKPFTVKRKIAEQQNKFKLAELTDDEAVKLVRLIKLSSDQNGILIMKSLRNSVKKALTERRKRPSFQKVVYSWIKHNREK